MFKKIIKILDRIEEEILVAMFIAMVAIIFFQVIMRYVFNNSLEWSEELGKFLFVWVSWLGISIGHKRKEHIAITMVIDKISQKGRLICNILTEAILATICGVTAYYGILMIQVQQNVPYAAIKISTSWGYLSLVTGCTICMIISLVHLGSYINELRGKTPPEEIERGGQI